MTHQFNFARAGFGFAAAAFITVRYPALTDLVTVRPWDGLLCGTVMLILLTEGTRRFHVLISPPLALPFSIYPHLSLLS